MPSKRTPDGEFRDIAHPIVSYTRKHVQEEVMRVYEETADTAEGQRATGKWTDCWIGSCRGWRNSRVADEDKAADSNAAIEESVKNEDSPEVSEDTAGESK